MKKYGLLICVLILPGCGHVRIEQEFNGLKNKTRHTLDQQIDRGNPHYYKLEQITANQADQGLTRDDAVSIALKNNPTLRAEFENLGIAKADLVQAGLFTNPTLDGIFAFPSNKNNDCGRGAASIDAYGTMRISDLWLVPLSKRVAQDVLEITSLRILTTIVGTIASTKNAYDYCLFIESKLKLMHHLLASTIKLQEETSYQQNYGYTTDYNMREIESKKYALEAEIEAIEQLIKTAYIQLEEAMGFDPHSSRLKLSDSLLLQEPVPSLEVIQDYALNNHPEILIAHTKIEQFKDTIRVEKAKIFKNVNAGVSFQREFGATEQGWGPTVIVDLPIFDTNYAQVAKAEFLLNQAQELLIATEIKIKSDIVKAYESLVSTKKQIGQYGNVLSASRKAVDAAYEYTASMQVNAITALRLEIIFNEVNLKALDLQLKAHQELVKLERAAGKKLVLIDKELEATIS